MQFAWDTQAQTPLLLTDGSTVYIYGPNGLPVESIDGLDLLYFHHDQLGSTTLLTSLTGAVGARYSYTAYGEEFQSRTGTVSNQLLFQGGNSRIRSLARPFEGTLLRSEHQSVLERRSSGFN